jgi:ribosome maturation factor RimP
LEVREEVRQLADPLAAEDGLELVDVELLVQGGRRTVRVLLDRPGGIQVADCARFSRRLSDCLDMNQTINGAYHLEVSSPGVERPLKTLAACERFVGKRAALTAAKPRDGRRHFEGELLAPTDGRVGLRAEDGVEHWFEWAEVKAAHLVVDPWAGRRSAGALRQGGGRR